MPRKYWTDNSIPVVEFRDIAISLKIQSPYAQKILICFARLMLAILGLHPFLR